MVAFKDFDMVDSFCLDYMHNVTLGVFKAMATMWLKPANKQRGCYINKKNKRILDLRLLSIKKCSFIGRPTRSLTQLAILKACELRNLLLYYLRNCLIGLLPKKYVDHFHLLSACVYRLLKSEIRHDELNIIEADLNRFVKEYGLLYGEAAMTMNVHLISHLVQNVRNSGPLWCTSMFAFESNNGHLVKSFHGTTDVLLQITSRYILRHINHIKEPSKSIEKSIIFCGKKKRTR